MKINQLSKCAGIGVFFLFANLNAQTSETLINNYIKKDVSFKNSKGFKIQVLNEGKIDNLKVKVIDVQQYYENTPIYQSLAKAVIKNGEIISFINNFHKADFIVVEKKIDKEVALSKALTHLNITSNDFKIMDENDGDLINLSDDKVASARFYFLRNNNLIPAQQFFINQSKSNLHYSILVSLENGQILDSDNMMNECNFTHNQISDDIEVNKNHNHLLNIKSSNKNTNKTATDASYNIFPFPLEAPTFGSRETVSNPWDLNASPEGWHSNGNQNFNYTRGNNVFAYIDNNASNAVGEYPTSTSNTSLSFDFPFQEGTTISAYDNKKSSVTNLFYANNMIHDIFYKFGFTEASRNFQVNNFDKGGIGEDAVFAEAFDGSGYNNANFAAGYERKVGSNNQVQAPRMQMFLWNQRIPLKQRLFYNDPTYSNRAPVNSANLFYGSSGLPGYYTGKNLMEAGVSGDVAIPTVNTACSTLNTGSLTGKIALVTYTGCTLDTKVRNAKNAGAVGVIIDRGSNSLTDQYLNAVATDINIPAIILGSTESAFISTEITNGNIVNVSLKDLGFGYKNSSFDNGVIIHEYGHGISNRLTGQGYSCLQSLEQMGEGWSDFFALMLTNKPNASGTTARGIGTYSNNTATTAVGIRQYRYTTNMSVNPHTYADTNLTGGQPHAVGEIWATMLWDLHWKMAEKYGYNSDVTADPNSGSAKTLQLVMDGLKLQPCNPGFIAGRDAILQADALAGGTDNCLIWNVFARRGLGVNASAGSATLINDQVNGFDVPEACNLSTDDIVKNKSFGIYPNPAKGEFFIKNAPTVGNTTVKVDIIDLSGKVVKSFERKKNSSDAVSTQGMVKGTYLVVVTENGKSDAQKLIVD